MNQIRTVKNGAIKHLSTYGLALFFFLTPFEYPLADLMSISPLRIIGLFAMGLAVVDLLMQRTVKIDFRVSLVLLWLMYGLLTYLWAVSKIRFRSYYSIYFNNALMFLLFSMVSFTKREAEILKKSLVYGVGALLLYMVFIPGAVMYSDYQNRMTLNAGRGGLDQNYLAALMLMAFGIVFYNFCNVKEKKQQKIISIIFCTAIAYCILLTGSRSGVLAVLLIILLSINTTWKTRLSIGIPLIVLLLIVLPFVAQYLPEDLLERFSLTAFVGLDTDSGLRFLIWKQAISSLHGIELLFGYGTGASQTIVGNIFEDGVDRAIHNHYIAMIVEFGIIGSLLINIPIFKTIKSMLGKERGAVIAFGGVLLMAFFLDVVTTKFFWSAMILMSVMYSSNGYEKSREII